MTAFEESLARIARGEDPNGNSIPKYITDADSMSVANGNKTFLDSAFDTVSSIPKFIGVSMISGANQLYNIPADIGNLISEDSFERTDTAEIISGLNSNLGAFYEDNQEGADLMGFMVSSLVPGIGGMKILNAGQKSLQATIATGRFGSGTSKALGLLAPNKKAFADKALKEVVTNSSAAGLLQGNALKSMVAGFGQNAYEVIAFETAVAATMFNSPILENQDMGDFFTNIALGAGIFGAIGGVIDATKLSSSLKLAGDREAVLARPWTFVESTAKISNPYERLAINFSQLEDMPSILPTLEPGILKSLTQAAQTKTEILQNRIRADIGELADGDSLVANTLFQTFKGASANDAMSAFIGARQVTNRTVQSKAVKANEAIEAKIAKGELSIKEMDEYLDAPNTTSVAYAKSWGEDAGSVLPDAPKITSVSDLLKPGQTVKITKDKVIAGDKSWNFSLNYNLAKQSKDKKSMQVWDIASATPLAANARYMWASKLPAFSPSAKAPLIVHVDDFPLMEKVMTELVDTPGMEFVKFAGLKNGEMIGTNFQNFLGARKKSMAIRLLSEPKKVPLAQEEVASIINVKNNFLSGQGIKDSVNDDSIKDLLAFQDHSAVYREKLVKQGASREALASFDTTGLGGIPQHLNITYDTSAFNGVNNFVVENMVIIREQQKLYQQANSNAAAGVLKEDYFRFEEITTGRVYSSAVPSGAGATLFGAANGNYGSLAASVESIGKVTASVIDKAKAKAVETFEPLLYKLANDTDAAVEFSSLNARIRGIEGEYGLNESGTYLEPLALIRYRQAVKEAMETGERAPKAPNLPESMPQRIDMKNQNVQALVKAHIEVNGRRTGELASIKTAQGSQFNRAPDAFYPIPVDTKDFPFFAMVSDATVTSGNHRSMLYANSESELRGMVDKLRSNPQLSFRFKDEIKEHHLAENTFQYEKSMNSNYLDTEVKRKGVSQSFLVPTDPKKITDDFMKWHYQRETGLVREAVSAKYEVQFEELARLGKTDTSAATSTLSGAADYAEEAIKNPFADYIKSALNIAKTADYPWWTKTNEMADRAVSTLLNKVSSLTYSAKTPAELAEVNRLLVQGGYKGGVYTEDMAIFANSSANRGELSNSIAKANALMATVVLRMDPLNAATNAISSTVLLGAETKAIFRAIERGDKEAAGALADLTRIKVPGTQETILAPKKLISNAVLKFGKNTPEMQFYRENGFITSISDQYNKAIDSLTFDPVKGARSWDKGMDKLHSELKKLGDKGEFWTGNKLAEEFNRFVAADVMKQMSDVAVKRGLMSNKEQLAYINTFVNRTQGNYLAAQRPMLFQGPIGQSIGLFQTYQFNLIQQLLRHVGEGGGKDAMTLLALQGTIHGMNGLPGFSAINTHLVGNASGNTEHKDAYSALYGTVGKEAGDWLMYGLGSNVSGLLHPDLKVNLYTRGDINPRQVTIIPTNPADIPFIQATGKVMSNLYDTAKQLNNGGDVFTTILQGLENNGLSRPLAGLAQTLQGFNNPEQASYSTSNRGNVVAANDLLSLTNLARITGGKPLDEAVALDATYRFKAYALKDTRRRSALGKAIKSNMIGGKNPTTEQIEDFAASYVESGGRQVEFNQWFGQLYKTANLSQANKIQQSLTSPFTQSMQDIMGGEQLRDFSKSIPEPNDPNDPNQE
jgi:hypothetical protein